MAKRPAIPSPPLPPPVPFGFTGGVPLKVGFGGGGGGGSASFGGATTLGAGSIHGGSNVNVKQGSMSFREPLKPGRQRVSLIPQLPFRGNKLLIGVQPDDLIVHGIYVGPQLQSAGVGAVDGAVYANGAPVSMDTAMVGQQIVIDVETQKGGRIGGILYGDMVVSGSGELPAQFEVEEPEPLVEEAALAVQWEEERYEPGVSLEELRKR